MKANKQHVEALQEILADFAGKNPQTNLSATDTQRELAEKIAVEWGSWRGSIRDRTEAMINAYASELEKVLEKHEEIHVER
jgi:hypothetical protein